MKCTGRRESAVNAHATARVPLTPTPTPPPPTRPPPAPPPSGATPSPPPRWPSCRSTCVHARPCMTVTNQVLGWLADALGWLADGRRGARRAARSWSTTSCAASTTTRRRASATRWTRRRPRRAGSRTGSSPQGPTTPPQRPLPEVARAQPSFDEAALAPESSRDLPEIFDYRQLVWTDEGRKLPAGANVTKLESHLSDQQFFEARCARHPPNPKPSLSRRSS